MKLVALAGLFTATAIPFAGAAEASADCQLDDARRASYVRIDNGAQGGSAPAARQAADQRGQAAERTVQRETAEATRAAADRRRNGKPIPDSELIGPRGAL